MIVEKLAMVLTSMGIPSSIIDQIKKLLNKPSDVSTNLESEEPESEDITEQKTEMAWDKVEDMPEDKPEDMPMGMWEKEKLSLKWVKVICITK